MADVEGSTGGPRFEVKLEKGQVAAWRPVAEADFKKFSGAPRKKEDEGEEGEEKEEPEKKKSKRKAAGSAAGAPSKKKNKKEDVKGKGKAKASEFCIVLVGRRSFESFVEGSEGIRRDDFDFGGALGASITVGCVC